MTDLGDRLAVRELIERYAEAVIHHDAAAWSDTWTADGAEWIVTGHPKLKPVAGRPAIVAAWEARMAAFAWVMFAVQIGSIEIDGDTAQARSFTTETYKLGDGRRGSSFGRYDDLLIREEGGWRFRRRTFAPLFKD